jgi:co-chaperonin GroES (HSP10)
MPRTPRKKRALRLALEAAEKDGLIVKIRDDGEVAAYGLGKIHKDSDTNDFDLKKENVVIFDKSAGTLRFTKSHKQSEILALFEKYQEVYTAGDIRLIVVAAVYAFAGITLRQTGGVYFLPEVEPVQKLSAFFAGITGEFYHLPIIPESDAKGQVAKIAKAEILAELQEANEDLDKYLGKDNTRDSTLSARLTRYATISRRAQTYKELLEIDITLIQKGIKDLRVKVEKALDDSDTADDSAKRSDLFPEGAKVSYDDPGSEFHGSHGVVVGHGKARGYLYNLVRFTDGEVGKIFSQYLKSR